MPKRCVDKRKTSKALRKLRQAAERASDKAGLGLTSWEKDFVEGVTGRLEKYGSAFRDPHKGRLEEPLSHRQAHVVRVLDKKSRRTRLKDAERKSDGASIEVVIDGILSLPVTVKAITNNKKGSKNTIVWTCKWNAGDVFEDKVFSIAIRPPGP